MANQQEPNVPLSNNGSRTSADLLPKFYRTDSNKKFLSATLDQLTQPGTVKKVTGFIGRQNSKAVKSSDVFINATDDNRQNYQLEPAAVIQDYLGNTTFYKDYIDYINDLETNGGITDNHSRMNQQEFYSWNPHIDWDKFVNFQQYYWLPYGPSAIEVQGQQLAIESTYTVTVEDQGDNYVYIFSPDGLTRNPTLTLYRGQTYHFSITAPNNPFSIKTSRVSGNLEMYTEGVSANSVENGILTFTVQENAPDVLFYVSSVDANTGGVLEIKDITENSFLDLETDILGKKTYTTGTGVKLSNGMKLFFTGNTTPEKYANGNWYVEGVGTAIKLVNEKDLEIISAYSTEVALLFDDEPFDQAPFSTLTSFPKDKDYVVMNRASADRNQWSRYNRWFHQDVVITTAAAAGQVPDLDQLQRATRPIIEFKAGLKLYNFGHQAKENVDVIDTFTADVFSTVEGSLGYNIDGIDLADGMRVLFTADTDRFVNGKIFRVKFINVTVPGRTIEFFPSSGVNVDSNVITFPNPHGLTTGTQVIYLNNGNSSVEGLVNRKIYYVVVINTTDIRLYADKSLNTQVNIIDIGSSTHSFETFSGYRRQINLIEESDATPVENETVLINVGLKNQGLMYWYNGRSWQLGQHKTTTNQPPLFDIFDSLGNSYGNISVYEGSSFNGSKLFSYKVGTGSNDSALGFPLSYQNISNIGDIVFEFNLLSDSFTYKELTSVLTKNTDVGYVRVIDSIDKFSYQNGWIHSKVTTVQPIVRIFKESGLVNNFPIDVYDFKDQLDDLSVKVFINGRRQNNESFMIVDGSVRKSVVLINDVTLTDVVILKCSAAQAKNENGYYEIPLNLQNNPLNVNVTQFTLGEVIDHVDTIVENISTFSGVYPGYSNIRDLGNITPYGTRFVQHSGPMNLSLYHLGSKTANIVKALDKARLDYGKFKRAFITFASESGIDTDPRQHVDFVLQELAKDKTKTQPYYLSDMFSYLGAVRSEYIVLDSRIKTYPLTQAFNLETLSNRSVNIYLNEQQLIHGRDYEFGTDIFFNILVDLAEGDMIEAFEYESTDGSYCPPTPTKLGLYPAFEPKIYLDTTYLEPTNVIQGHDGSITIAFNDYRDQLILELETRIFNNIKVKYDSTIFDIYSFIPGYSRDTSYSKAEFDSVLSQYFFQWTTNISQDYTQQNNAAWSRLNPFTWNYRDNSTPDENPTPAFWRGIYRWTLDTDRPHTHPWECLGFSIEPKWWTAVYGAAPYTSNNLILWNDIKNGTIREPGFPIRTQLKFAKSILETGAPVDEDGNLLDPYNAGQVSGYIKPTAEGYFTFGDVGPVESAWRRSSYYAFALMQTALLLKPNHVLGVGLDRSRIVRNNSDQLVYSDTELRIRLDEIKLPSTALNTTRIFTSGLINYVVDYITSDVTLLLTQYTTDLSTLTNKLSSKLGGFTSKPKFKLLLDSKSLSSTGGVFVPEENYDIILNTSSPVKKVVYSGVVITKYADGYEVRGYNNDNPYFTYYPYALSGRSINVGGISESYVSWSENKYYIVGKLVKANNQYYRVKTAHQSGSTFDPINYTKLAELPITGGRDAVLRKTWNKNSPIVVGYGTKFNTIQEIVDFIQGYGIYLEDEGFIFDDYNINLKSINNWETSIKEFLFWTTQNWAEGSVLSLSPAANKLLLKSETSVVNNIQDDFFEYKIFRVDGQKLDSALANSFREGNIFTLAPTKTSHGIYGATLYLVQKEHVLLLDNTTLFNDIIYDQAPGYRQERIKVIGYLSTNWNGGFNIPGFIYDQALLKIWEQWTDYNLGDIVKYKEFYYSASRFLPGTSVFESVNWIKLDEQPTSQLLPNWDYKANQFADFYSLDSDNFDVGQQTMAQHLIGYQKRQYLENIIQDDVSQYKFYQGMIIEKGTQNVFNKLFDVLSADGMESLSFNEEWAVRVGNYGASSAFEEIEFKLDESKFKLNPQPFELVSAIDPSTVDFVYRQVPTDVYIKPVGYTNNVWSTDGTTLYLRTPGYVRYEDTKLHIDSLNDIVTYDISTFKEGDYVWCAFEGRDWDIYRFTKSNFEIENVNYSSNTLTIQFTNITSLTAGDIIGITNSSSIAGFYKITSVDKRNVYITTTIKNWSSPFPDLAQVLVYEMPSVRIGSIDELNSAITNSLSNNELIWADNNGAGMYAVYKYATVFNQQTLVDVNAGINAHFGKAVALSANGLTAAVSNANNTVIVYTKSPTSTVWRPHIELTPDLSVSNPTNLNFGIKLSFSPDNNWLVVAANTASNVNGSSFSQQGYVAVYNTETYVHEVLVSQSPAASEFFGTTISLSSTGILAVAATGYSGTTGRVYFYRYTGSAWVPYATPVSVGTNTVFGYSISLSADASTFVVSAPAQNNYAGAVYIYSLISNQYVLTQTINSSNTSLASGDQLGHSVAISATGTYIAVGVPFTDSTDTGKVLVYVSGESNYILDDTLTSTRKEPAEKFGFSVNFMNDDRSLIVFSANGDILNTASFDVYSKPLLTAASIYGTIYVNDTESAVTGTSTTFDNNSLKIVDTQIDSGRIDVYDRYNKKFIYGESLLGTRSTDQTDAYGDAISASNNIILVGAPNDVIDYTGQGNLYAYYRAATSKSWTTYYQEAPRPNAFKIKKAYIYDRINNELASYIDVVDPIQGKIPGPADQEISYKTYFDPAVYSVGTNSVNVDDGMNWTKEHVGSIWWDLTRAKFLDNQIGGVVYRSTTWNTLYETASIDIYEWTETKYLPSEWDKLSGTDKGNSIGVSGLSRYGDSVYSIKKKYDSISKTFLNTYYYWVKNPTVVPRTIGRSLSAYNISRLISDPVSEGYTCLSLTGTDSFSLINATNLINGTNFNLTVQNWLVDLNYTGNNAHNQWKIISDHPNTIIPLEIEKKWIHSLTGKDDFGRVVPDTKLPFKQRYGVNFRPRQGMFINRVEALKQYIERVNSVLATRLIVDDYDLTDLTQFNLPPSATTGLWDLIIDTDAELRFVGSATIETALLHPIIVDGRIVGADIISAGHGYVNAPYVIISNTSGRNAHARTIIDNVGKVIGIDIISSGEGYLDNTTFTVRPYTVLVSSDSNTFDKWSTYAWNSTDLTWDRVKGQSYDVSKYWNYIDWYAAGYNQYTKIDKLVDNTYNLALIDLEIGQIVKVKNIGTGGWLLLEKYNNLVTIDYTQNYKVIGRQNGTIVFLDALYNYKSIGYDSVLYDSTTYDDLAEIELKIIIDTIKNKIFVDELRSEYLKLFFASIRYVLAEQTFIDWAFKTSFVKATHNVGELKEKVNYNSDNLDNFEDYINEVKPYRTQVREYVSSYNKLDNSQSSVTDFDLIPIVTPEFKVVPVDVRVNQSGVVESVTPELITYPWKHWNDHLGFTVESITLVDSGSGYISNPIVTIDGGFGSGATAKAYIANGRVNRLILTSHGSGYLKAPTITISGGLSVNGVAARAAVKIESEVVRANKISIKFDRVSRTYVITELTETETFTGTGSRLQFSLKFSPEAKIGTSSVNVNGVDVLRDDYTLTTRSSTTRGYTSYSGLLTLVDAPATGSNITITYTKNLVHMSATDRINFYYNPETGQYGKDLAQLMTGIDYGGVSVTGVGFNISGGWDSLPWFTDSWDGFDATFDDRVFSAGTAQYEYDLNYAPVLNEEINIYVNGQRIDDPYYNLYDGITPQPNGRLLAPPGTVMSTIIGDGVTEIFTLPLILDITEGDKVIFRKSNSDGSFTPLQDEYDTALSGGAFAGNFTTGVLTSATGLTPDDIILDGDGMVTPMTSAAPEEIVPGHITDALAIKVYQLPTSGSAKIMFNNYVADGIANEYSLGQTPNNFASCIVKIDNVILKQNIDYVINWQDQVVVLNIAPVEKTIVTVITFGVASQMLMDTDYFISDGETLEYVTSAAWIEGLGSILLVDGLAVNYELFRTSESYDSPEKVGIRFAAPVNEGALITYMITADENQTASVIKTEIIPVNGIDRTFTLINQIGNTAPYANNVVVISNGQILRPSNTEYFTLANDILDYTLTNYKAAPFIPNPIDYKVYINGVELTYGSDYVFDLSVVSINLRDRIYVNGGVLSVVGFADAEYTINNGEITFATALSGNVEVMSFFNHDVENIIRTSEFVNKAVALVNGSYDYYKYYGLVGGSFKLSKMIAFDDYVWVIKNNQMLTHSVDYYLDSDLMSIKLKTPLLYNDILDVICFSDRVVNHSYGYMQFKDMLNRTHYKRISKAKSTRLARDLLQKDAEIYLIDGTKLSEPNPARNLPGIIEINGERIEYFTKVGNILSQLRRATLGTGAPALHRARTIVLDIGASETIPYTDKQIVETTISDGVTTNISLNYTPKVYNPKTNQHDYDTVEVFAGGIRLKKVSYTRYEETNGYPYSPEGDSSYDEEFTADGVTSGISLTNVVTENAKIVVVKKIGREWGEPDLVYSSTDIANFIKNTEAVFSQYLADKYQYVLATDDGATLLTDGTNEPLELD